jgi:transposase
MTRLRPLASRAAPYAVGRAAFELRPLVEAVADHVLPDVIHGDDTPVPVLAPGTGKTATGRLWVYVRDERPWPSPVPPAVLYHYSPDRKGFIRAAISLASAASCRPTATRLQRAVQIRRRHRGGCFAHVRRKFFDIHAANGSPIAH